MTVLTSMQLEFKHTRNFHLILQECFLRLHFGEFSLIVIFTYFEYRMQKILRLTCKAYISSNIEFD